MTTGLADWPVWRHRGRVPAFGQIRKRFVRLGAERSRVPPPLRETFAWTDSDDMPTWRSRKRLPGSSGAA